MSSSKWLVTAASAAALAVGVAACGDSGNSTSSGNGGGSLSGSIRIDGSSTVGPLTQAVAEEFNKENPGVDITVGQSGTGGGFEKFCAGETEINDASREIEPEEATACGKAGIKYEDTQVANDALTVALNPANPNDCLSVEQLAQIWGPKDPASNWSEVKGADSSFSAEIQRFGPGTTSGTFDYFTGAINGEEGVQTKDYNNVGEDDNQTVTGVEGSEGGIGYFGFSYYQENSEGLKAAEVENESGKCVAPSRRRSRTAPITRSPGPCSSTSDGHCPAEAGGEGPPRLLRRTRQRDRPVGRVHPDDRPAAVQFEVADREAGRLTAKSAQDRRGSTRHRRLREPARFHRGRGWRRRARATARRSIYILLGACAVLSVLTTTAIVISLVVPSVEFFGEVPLTTFLFTSDWGPTFTPPTFGVLPIVVGTLSVTFWAMLFAIPIGLGAAVYLSEYAGRRTRRTIKPVLEILAGVPTIAFGFFALKFITPTLQDIWPGNFLNGPPLIFSALAAGLAIGLMIVPIIASISEDAMSAVPHGLREGAYALGATKARVSTRVVFPRPSRASSPRSSWRSRERWARR